MQQIIVHLRQSDSTGKQIRGPWSLAVESGILLRTRLDLVNVGLSWALISGHKERIDLGILGQPRCHLAEFFAQASNCLVIHVGLSNKLWHCN